MILQKESGSSMFCCSFGKILNVVWFPMWGQTKPVGKGTNSVFCHNNLTHDFNAGCSQFNAGNIFIGY